MVELAVQGEYNGQDAAKRTKESLELRSAATNVFEVGNLGYITILAFIISNRTSSAKKRLDKPLFNPCFHLRVLVSFMPVEA